MRNNTFLRIFRGTVVIVPLVLCGCNTMEGAGEDIQHAGKALERAAERNKECSHPCPHCSYRERCPRL